MIKHRDDRHDDKRDDGDVIEKRREEVTAQDAPALQAVTSGAAMSALTVTVANPTPPTNIAYDVYGTPPTPASMTFKDDGVPVAPTVIATPLSVVAPQGTVAEATGSVVIDNDQNNTQSVTVMGTYTNSPNATHPSTQAPTVLPTITALAPNNIAGTGGTATLTVTGTGFTPSSVVNLAGVPQQTNYISATSLSVSNAAKRTSAGNIAVTVVTGGTATAATNWVFT